MSVLISPSVLACDMLHLEAEIRKAESSGADWIHCDVMDGLYVPNISFGFDFIKSIGKVTSLPLDVHMMTEKPYLYLEKLKTIGAYSVTIHHDNMGPDGIDVIHKIHDFGMKCGIALSPRIPAETVFPLLKYIDMVLIMSVEPGFGGQKFHPECSEKIPLIKTEMKKQGLNLPVQIDGGINLETASKAIRDGADNLVVGTASFGAPDMKAVLDTMKSFA